MKGGRMKGWIKWTVILVSIVPTFVSCNAKKSDADIFDQSPVRLVITADVQRGIEPLYVEFSGYLETEETTVTEEVTDVLWIIDGPGSYHKEIAQESYNYQDESANDEAFFHFNYDFLRAGNYRVKAIVNKGKYRSHPVRIHVEEDRNRQ